MVEGYIHDECLGFIAEYVHRFDVVEQQVWDVNEEDRDAGEMSKGVGKIFT